MPEIRAQELLDQWWLGQAANIFSRVNSQRDLRVTATNRDLCKHTVTNKAGHRQYVKWRRNRRSVSVSFNLIADGKMTKGKRLFL